MWIFSTYDCRRIISCPYSRRFVFWTLNRSRIFATSEHSAHDRLALPFRIQSNAVSLLILENVKHFSNLMSDQRTRDYRRRIVNRLVQEDRAERMVNDRIESLERDSRNSVLDWSECLRCAIESSTNDYKGILRDRKARRLLDPALTDAEFITLKDSYWRTKNDVSFQEGFRSYNLHDNLPSETPLQSQFRAFHD